MPAKKQTYKQIGTVSKELGIEQSTLRYWETKFPITKPQFQDKKRIYDQEIITLLKGINFLITKKGYTTKKVQRLIEEEGRDYIIELVELPLIHRPVTDEPANKRKLQGLLPEASPENDPKLAEVPSPTRKQIDLSALLAILNSAGFDKGSSIPEVGKVTVDVVIKDRLQDLYRKLDNIKSRMA